MSYLVDSCPILWVHVRNEFLHDQKEGHGEFTAGTIFGVTSLHGRALGFQVLLETGAVVDRLPITAIVHDTDNPAQAPLDWLQIWDCFSPEFGITAYEFLKEMRCRVLLKDKQWYYGHYVWTIDWCGTNDADDPGEGGHKSGNLIALDNGCFTLQPNNRCIFMDASTTTKLFPRDARPSYRTNSHVWKCEATPKWAATEDTDAYFYDYQELENGQGKDK